MHGATLFISYRRDDSAGYARAVCDELARRFGAERVFMDVDDIDPGHAFAETIQRALAGSAVALVLIGPRWSGPRAGQPPRLHDADDLVRLEVDAALRSGARVIPLLLDGTPMPAVADFPVELRALAGRNALELDNSRFAADIERLVAALRESMGGPAQVTETPGRLRRPAVWALALGALAVAVSVGWAAWGLRGAGPAAAPEARESVTDSPRAAINGEWRAELNYDWPNARYTERFVFGGEADTVHGTASFLGVPRGVLEGKVEPGGLSFVTRTQETGRSGDVTHRYRAKLAGAELQFVMQTEGAATPHAPVTFVARRVSPAP